MLFLRFAGTIIEQCVLYNIHWNRFFPILNIYYSNPNMVQWCLLSEECGVSHSKTKKLLKNEVFLALCSFSNLIAISAGSISALAIVQFHFFSLFLSCFSQFNFSAGNVISSRLVRAVAVVVRIPPFSMATMEWKKNILLRFLIIMVSLEFRVYREKNRVGNNEKFNEIRIHCEELQFSSEKYVNWNGMVKKY